MFIASGLPSATTARRPTFTLIECEPAAPSLSVTVSVTVYAPAARYVRVPVMLAPEAVNVPGTVAPLPQSSNDCHGASEPGSVKVPLTPTDWPDTIDRGVVAFSETVGATLATVTVCDAVFCQPNASLTTSVAV